MNADTRCIACGTRLPSGAYFCDGYRGPYDTYMCYCDCHWVPSNRFYAPDGPTALERWLQDRA